MIEDVKTKKQLYYLENKEKIIAKRLERYHANKELELEKMKEYRDANKEKIKAVDKKYREENREKCLKKAKTYRELNAEKIRQSRSIHYQNNKQKVLKANDQWRVENPDKMAAISARRRAAKRDACVSWADDEKVLLFYSKAQNLTKETDVAHEVDHIVPLVNDFVCGLHNEFNLDVLTKPENIRKGNRWWPDMPDTSDPELIALVTEFKKRNSET